jgi:hypothetical protein
MDRIAGDPARIFGREEGNDATDIVRSGKTLECLHAERKLPASGRGGLALTPFPCNALKPS